MIAAPVLDVSVYQGIQPPKDLYDATAHVETLNPSNFKGHVVNMYISGTSAQPHALGA